VAARVPRQDGQTVDGDASCEGAIPGQGDVSAHIVGTIPGNIDHLSEPNKIIEFQDGDRQVDHPGLEGLMAAEDVLFGQQFCEISRRLGVTYNPPCHGLARLAAPAHWT